MSIVTQGTQLFVLAPKEADPTTKEVLTIKGLTSFNPGANPADQIEDTPLEADTKTYQKGLRTPSQSTANINADPREPSHVRLNNMADSDSDENLIWAVGMSDGKSVPTVNATGDDFILPTDRSWYKIIGKVSDFPLTFETNSIVKTELQIQRSGKAQWLVKA